jgi:hypothetical protein
MVMTGKVAIDRKKRFFGKKIREVFFEPSVSDFVCGHARERSCFRVCKKGVVADDARYVD